MAVAEPQAHRAKTVYQKEQMLFRQTADNARSTSGLSSGTYLNLPHHKRPPKVSELSRNILVGRRQNSVLCRTNHRCINKYTQKWTNLMQCWPDIVVFYLFMQK